MKREHGNGPIAYVTCACLGLAIYLPLISWVSLWVGLWMRTRFKAIMTALGVVVGWFTLPPLVIVLIMEWLNTGGHDDVEWLLLLSPASILAGNEFSQLHNLGSSDHGVWLTIVPNFIFYGLALVAFRYLALSRAERYLRGR